MVGNVSPMPVPTQSIREYIVEDQSWDGDPAELTDDLPLIENRVLDSMGLLRLVGWLEEHFDIAIPDEEIVPDNFGTLERIAALVERKQTA